MDAVRIIDPTGSEPPTQGLMASPRPVALAERRIGVLDNGKPNAAYVIGELGRHLARRFGAQEPVSAGKPNSSHPCSDEVLDGFRNFDAAIVGVGD